MASSPLKVVLPWLCSLALLGCEGSGYVDSPEGEAPTTAVSAIDSSNLGGSNLGGVNLGGSNLSDVNLSGPNLGGTNLGGTNLAGANLGGTNLAGPNLGGNNLSGPNLGGANLAGTNLAGTNLAGTNLSGSNLSGSNLAGSNLAGSNLAGTNLAGLNLAAATAGFDFHLINENQSGITTTGTWTTDTTTGYPFDGAYKYAGAAASMTIPFNGVRVTLYGQTCHFCGTMRVKVDNVQVAMVDLYSATGEWRQKLYTTPAKTKGNHTVTLEWTGTKNAASVGTRVNFDALTVDRGAKLLRSGEDVFHADNKTKANNSACVVMGVGSTAFTRLVNANSGGQMYALLDKLPWGFTTASGGALELDAWEAVVWGSNTYCVFVIPAPKGATLAGVGGFIKAIFRWNAPPWKSISIGQLGGGMTPLVFSGMMNASSYFAAGTLSDANLIAGMLSFITSTTNNISVQVDFASYIQLNDGTYRVLGNPTVLSGTTQYPEGAFMTVLIDEGGGNYSYRILTYATKTNSYYTTLLSAYDRAPVGAKPAAKRCLGAKYLQEMRSVAVPGGKCDNGTGFRDATISDPSIFFSWTSMANAYNNALTSDLDVPKAAWVDNIKRTVIGGTHVFLNETPVSP